MILSEKLRACMQTYVDVGGLSMRQIAIGADVSYAALHRFLRGGDIAMSTADRLAAWAGFTIKGTKRFRLSRPRHQTRRAPEPGILRFPGDDQVSST